MSAKKNQIYKVKDEPRFKGALIGPYSYTTEEVSVEIKKVAVEVLRTEVIRHKKSLPQILDEMDDNIRAAAEAARKAEEAARAAAQAAGYATKASTDAEKRAEEAKKAGQLAAKTAIKAAAEAARKAEETAKAGRLAAEAAAVKAETADVSAKAAAEAFRKAAEEAATKAQEACNLAKSTAEKSTLAVIKEATNAKKIIGNLREYNSSLLGRIRSLEERFTAIENSLPSEKVILLREISKKDAIKEIHDLFSKNKTLYYSDIAELLNLDLQSVVEICNEMQKRGEIEVDDDAL